MSSYLSRLRERVEHWRLGLAAGRSDGLLALLGLASGLAAGTIIVAFRFSVSGVQSLYMHGLPSEAFEWLETWLRVLVPTVGGLVLGIGYALLTPRTRTVGVVHVLERLHYHQGHMPWRNLATQFVGGALALASGQSVGREAPSVHLGAAVASLMARRLLLPNNAVRTLVACGAAAAIAASFNTPLAGVVFAMEVIMAEYTIAGFVPVILAAVAATAITRAVYGDDTAFTVPLLGLASLWELVWIVAMGVLIGIGAAGFIATIRGLGRLGDRVPVALRFTLVGFLVGIVGIVVPEVLGLGYDTVGQTLAGQLGLAAMASVFLAKFAASALCIAARMPGGLIGPTVVLGSLAGGCFAALVAPLPGVTTAGAMYAMLGMAAMMGAVLQAPLAALLALLEMTGNPHIILPAMLAVVSAALTARIGFGQESVFTLMLRDAGLDYRHDALSQGLRRLGIAAVMNRSFERAARHLPWAEAIALLQRGPHWLIVEHADERQYLLRAADLARYCEAAAREQDAATDDVIDLVAIPAERFELRPVHLQATLHEAREIMNREGVDALYVRRQQAPMTFRTFGVVLRADVETGYALRV
ncbi:MAG: chloride channel protein [Gammaproteobacteria bacterium]